MADNDTQNTALPLKPGDMFENYRVMDLVGRGAMASVYLAKNLETGQYAALKVLSPALSEEAEYISRFRNEAGAAAAVNHPNIIRIFSTKSTVDGLHCIIMEYVDGSPLIDLIKQNGSIPLKQALSLGIQVADALAECWDKHKLTHGDIKPENIMMDSAGNAKIADFGLAKSERYDFDSGDLILTPLYAPPELLRQNKAERDCRSDIYSFGATLYHAIAGTPPFQCSNVQELLDRHLNENPEPLCIRSPLTPMPVSNFIGKMLLKDPDKRPGNWHEVSAVLKHLLDTLEPSPAKNILIETAQPVQRFKKATRKVDHTVLAWVVSSCILLAGIIIWLSLIRNLTKDPERLTEPEPPATETARPERPEQPPLQMKDITSTETETADTSPVPLPELRSGLPSSPPRSFEDDSIPAPPATEQTPANPPAQQSKDQFTKSPELAEIIATLRIAQFLDSIKYDLDEQTPEENLRAALDNFIQGNAPHPMLDFLRDTAIPVLEQAKVRIITEQHLIAGTSFKYKDNILKFDKADYHAFDALLKTATGSIPVPLTWEQMNTQGALTQLCTAFMKRLPNDFTAKEPFIAILFFTGNHEEAKSALAALPDNEKNKLWSELLAIRDKSNKKLQSLVRLIDELHMTLDEYNLSGAAAICTKLLTTHSQVLPRQDLNNLRILQDKLPPYRLEFMAGNLMTKANSLEHKGKHYRAAVTALLVKNRYGNLKFPENSRIDSTVRECLNNIAPDETASLLTAPLPFQSLRSPEISYSLCNRENSPFFKAMTNIALVETGDFSMQKFFQDNTKFKNTLINSGLPGNVINAAALSFDFTSTLLANRMSTELPDLTWLETLNSKFNSGTSSPWPAAYTALLLQRSPYSPSRTELFSWTPKANPLTPEELPLLLIFLELQAEEGNTPAIPTLPPPETIQLSDSARLAFLQKLPGAIAAGGTPPLPPASAMEDWILLRSLPAFTGNNGLDDSQDNLVKNSITEFAVQWPLPAGETIYSWLLSRCSFMLRQGDINGAEQLAEWVLQVDAPCLFQYYSSFQALRAGLLLLQGKTGALQSAADAVKASSAPQWERSAFEEIAAVRRNYHRSKTAEILEKLPEGKSAAFWINFLDITLAYSNAKPVHDFSPIRNKYIPAANELKLAAALLNFCGREHSGTATP